MVVILGNADNIGYLAAKAFACQGTVVAMLHEAGEESCHIVDCLPGSSHLVMSGRLNHSSDLASFAGLVHTLYGRVDYLIICEDASVEVQGLSCSSRVRLSVLLEHAFVSGAMIVNMVSRSGKKGVWEEDTAGLENCLNRRDVRMSQIVIHRPVFRYVSQSRLASSACAAALFLCGTKVAIFTGNISWSMEGKLPGGPAGGRNHSCPCLIPAWSFAPFVHEWYFRMPDRRAIFLYSVVTKSVC